MIRFAHRPRVLNRDIEKVKNLDKNTQNMEKVSSIKGHVLDSKEEPISEVLVEFLEAGLRTYTDTKGAYSFTDVPVGHYTLRLIATGFIQIRQPFEITQDLENYVITMELSSREDRA